MRLRSYTNGGYGFRGIEPEGGAMNIPLKLSAVPVGDMDAVTKEYVDSLVVSFDASTISGSFSSARLPAWTGSDISSAGGGVFTLSTTSVVPGTYTKVVVDNKGRVTSGGSLTAGDIPNLGWSKVVDKPTTLAGYGITDVVSLSGGVMTGPLVLSMAPVASNELANKSYVDSKVGSSGGSPFVTGDIVYKGTTVTPTGYLRCNGGGVSKTTYASLYAIIGDTYSIGYTRIGSGRPWEQQYDLGGVIETGSPSAWVNSTYYFNYHLSNTAAFVTKSRVYALGGNVNTTHLETISSTTVNAQGSLTSHITSIGNLPSTVTQAKVVVIKNKVHLIGGYVNSIASGGVLSSTIDAEGVLSLTWTNGPSLPVPAVNSQVAVIGNRLYVFGSYTNEGEGSDKIYYSDVDNAGGLSTWKQYGTLPFNFGFGVIFVLKNRIYLTGAYGNGRKVIGCYINPDNSLSAWTTYNDLPSSAIGSAAFVSRNKVFIISGYPAGLLSANINVDGSLSTWSTETIPFSIRDTALVATGGRLLLLGGIIDGGYQQVVKTATISGGTNDYMSYYNANLNVITYASETNFNLPDLTSKDKPGAYSYIKY